MTMYTDGFKEEMVRRLIAPPGMSVRQLAAQTGVSKSQLWKWKVARRMTATKTGDKKWSAAEKLRVLGGGEAPLEGEAFGALLRREGLHEAQVQSWRDAAAEALGAEAAPSGLSNSELRHEFSVAKKRVVELERELNRKDKALAEAGALLLLEKKLQAIGWRNGAASTGKKSDE
jgi:transposase-like protein